MMKNMGGKLWRDSRQWVSRYEKIKTFFVRFMARKRFIVFNSRPISALKFLWRYFIFIGRMEPRRRTRQCTVSALTANWVKVTARALLLLVVRNTKL